MATKVYASNVDQTAAALGHNFTAAQNNLLAAYAMKEGASTAEMQNLANQLGIRFATQEQLNVRSLQLLAEQRFQHASQVLSLFSAILDKVDQLKQRLISKFSQG